MASLKALKNRISSVKSTQKITKAMKMVAAAKLRRAQQAAEAGRPYAERLNAVMASLAAKVTVGPNSPKLLAGTNGYLDKIAVQDVVRYEAALLSFMRENHADVLGEIRDTRDLGDGVKAKVKDALDAFGKTFA